MSQLDLLLTALLQRAEPLLQPVRDQTFQWQETGKGSATLVERNEFNPSLSFGMASTALKTSPEYEAAEDAYQREEAFRRALYFWASARPRYAPR